MKYLDYVHYDSIFPVPAAHSLLFGIVRGFLDVVLAKVSPFVVVPSACMHACVHACVLESPAYHQHPSNTLSHPHVACTPWQ